MNEEDTSNIESSEARTSNEKRINFAGKEVVYNTPRKNQVIELGPGGGDLLANTDVKEWLSAQDARYLGIEKDSMYSGLVSVVANAAGSKDDRWAAAFKGDYFNAENMPSPEIADEIWMKNSLAVNDETSVRAAEIAFNTLKKGGKVVYADVYTPYPEGAQQKILDGFREKGFIVERVDLTEVQDHPVMKTAKNQGFKPSNYLAFFASKPSSEE